MALSTRESALLWGNIKRIVWVCVLSFVLIILVRSLYNLYFRYRESTTELGYAQNALLQLTTRENDLKRTLAELETHRGQEREIRSRYNVAREGESLIVVVDEITPATTTPLVVPWWRRAVDFLIK